MQLLRATATAVGDFCLEVSPLPFRLPDAAQRTDLGLHKKAFASPTQLSVPPLALCLPRSTPHILLKQGDDKSATIIAKLEANNPLASVKVRASCL